MSGIPSWAVRGAKVVFIVDYKPHDMRGVVDYPKFNCIYTIRQVMVMPSGAYLLLEEIVNPIVMTQEGLRERAAEIQYFRPLHTIETDIEAHFKALLDVPNQVDA